MDTLLTYLTINKLRQKDPLLLQSIESLSTTNPSLQKTITQATCLSLTVMMSSTDNNNSNNYNNTDGYLNFLQSVRSDIQSILLLSPSLFDLCQGSRLHQPLSLKRKVGSTIVKALFPQSLQLQSLFLKSLAVVFSRAVSMLNNSSLFSLVPILDLVNHNNSDNAVHSLDETDGSVSLIACRDLSAGKEVFISYGDRRDPSMGLFRENRDI